MKNALVLDDHYGDDGHVTAGKILRGITAKRFEELEKSGLVREATDEEVEAGDQIPFEKDVSADLAPVVEDAADAGDKADEKKKGEADNKKAADPKNKEA